jgi:uncharacterized OB-fold protein
MNNTSERTIPAPPVNPENARFFEAAKEGTLLVGKCRDCRGHHFYPRAICPHCFSENVEWVPASGTGVVYSYSTIRRGVPVPYTIAYVTLDEGVSVMTNIVDCDPANIRIGMPVKLVFEVAEDGTPVPMFAPIDH